MSSMSFLSDLFSSDSESPATQVAAPDSQDLYGNSFVANQAGAAEPDTLTTLLDTFGSVKDFMIPLVTAADEGFGPVGKGINAVHGTADMINKGKDPDDAIAHQIGKFGAGLIPLGGVSDGLDTGLGMLDGITKTFFPDSEIADDIKGSEVTKLIKDVLPGSVLTDGAGELAEGAWNLFTGDFDDAGKQLENANNGGSNSVFQGLAAAQRLQFSLLTGGFDAAEQTLMTMGGDDTLLGKAGAAIGDDVVKCVEDPSLENISDTALKYGMPLGGMLFD